MGCQSKLTLDLMSSVASNGWFHAANLVGSLRIWFKWLSKKALEVLIMPVTKSARKRIHVTERRKSRNKSVRSLCKTNITKAEKLTFSGEREAAQKAVEAAISSLDKAAEKGIIHSNNAARRKSRLMKKLNKAQAGS